MRAWGGGHRLGYYIYLEEGSIRAFVSAEGSDVEGGNCVLEGTDCVLAASPLVHVCTALMSPPPLTAAGHLQAHSGDYCLPQ